jgi:hypothetical protein
VTPYCIVQDPEQQQLAATDAVQHTLTAQKMDTPVPAAIAARSVAKVVDLAQPANAACETTVSQVAHFAAALGSSKTSRIQVLHPGVEGSSSVQVGRFEDDYAATVTVRASVKIIPCTGDGDECVPEVNKERSMDVAVAFASSIAAQAAVSCSKCAANHDHDAVIASICLLKVMQFPHVVPTPTAFAGICSTFLALFSMAMRPRWAMNGS